MLERLTLDQYEFHILRISNEWFEEKKSETRFNSLEPLTSY